MQFPPKTQTRGNHINGLDFLQQVSVTKQCCFAVQADLYSELKTSFTNSPPNLTEQDFRHVSTPSCLTYPYRILQDITLYSHCDPICKKAEPDIRN